MKNQFILVIIFCALMSISSQSRLSNEAYIKAMETEIRLLYLAGSVEALQKSANAFTRIAEINPEEWLAHYYAAWAYVHMGFRSQGGLQEKDGFFAQAKMHAEKAGKISPGNAEIVAMQGYIIMGELSADPATRGQQLSALAMQTFGKAISMDKENPRALLMMAQMEWGTAQFFGQGPEKACGLLQSSLALFEKESATVEKESLKPTWGKEYAEGLKSEICKD
jgi:tetratricopeptide (TPR) repeat protein